MAKPENVKPEDLKKIFDQLKKESDESDESVGSYLYKGFRIQISKYKQTGAQRVQFLYKKRREQGLCIVCGKKVTKKNPSTGKLYRLCETHRKTIDNKS